MKSANKNWVYCVVLSLVLCVSSWLFSAAITTNRYMGSHSGATVTSSSSNLLSNFSSIGSVVTFDEDNQLTLTLATDSVDAASQNVAATTSECNVLHSQKIGDKIINTITTKAGEITSFEASADAEYIIGSVLTGSQNCVFVSGGEYRLVSSLSSAAATNNVVVSRVLYIGSGSITIYNCNLDGSLASSINNNFSSLCGALDNKNSARLVADESTTSATNGAAVYLANGANFTMQGGTISNFSATKNGGAIYAEANTTIDISGGTIKNNTAALGGAIYAAADSTISIVGGTISGNTANSGGAIYTAGTLTISADADVSPSFSGNTATADGGAIYGTADSAINIVGGTISDNTANNGGAIYAAGELVISADAGVIPSFSGNTATADGGAIYGAADSTINIPGGKFDTNTADNGGAIYTAGDMQISISVYSDEHPSFSGNTATTNGGTIYIEADSEVAITDATIDTSSAEEGGAIYSAGSLELKGVRITDCTSNGLGGAVYSEGKLILSGTSTIYTTSSYAIAAIGYISLNDDADLSGAVAGIYLSDNSYINLGTAVSRDYTIYKNNLTCYDVDSSAYTSIIAYSDTSSDSDAAEYLTAAASKFSITNYESYYTSEVVGDYLYCRYQIYTITIGVNNSSYGKVSSSSVSARYGTSISSTVNSTKGTLTIGDDTTITATPSSTTSAYSYTFSSWSNVPSSKTITSNTTITANFIRSTRYYYCYVYSTSTTTQNGAFSSTATNTTGGTASIKYGTTSSTDDSNPAKKYVQYGGSVTISAEAKGGYSFVGWYYASGTKYSSTTELSTTATGTFTYYAFFRLNYYTVTATAMYANASSYDTIEDASVGTTGGTVSPTSSTVAYDGSVTLTATPATGYSFVGWYTNSSGDYAKAYSSATYAISNIQSSATYYAFFRLNIYTITVEVKYIDDFSTSFEDASDGTTGGTVSPTSATVSYGESVTLTASPNDYYTFTGWYKMKSNGDYNSSSESTSTSYEISGSDVSDNCTFAALFTRKKGSFVVYARYLNESSGTIADGSNGVIGGTAKFEYNNDEIETTSASSVSTRVLYGDTVKLTATPATGYSFVGWYQSLDSSATPISTKLEYTTAEVSQYRNNYAAFFTLNYYTVTIQSSNTTYGTVNTSSVSSVPHGTTISTSGNTLTINKSTAVTVTATAKSSSDDYITYSFSKWTNAPSSVTSDVTITATFVRNVATYSVTIRTSSVTTAYGSITNDSTNVTSSGFSNITVTACSTISISSNELTIIRNSSYGGKSYSFTANKSGGCTVMWWSVASGTVVTEDITIIAYFGYTITIEGSSSDFTSSEKIVGAYANGVETTITIANATSYTWMVAADKAITIYLDEVYQGEPTNDYYGVSVNGIEYWDNDNVDNPTEREILITANTKIIFMHNSN